MELHSMPRGPPVLLSATNSHSFRDGNNMVESILGVDPDNYTMRVEELRRHHVCRVLVASPFMKTLKPQGNKLKWHGNN